VKFNSKSPVKSGNIMGFIRPEIKTHKINKGNMITSLLYSAYVKTTNLNFYGALFI
jgi:Na+-transporting NADH:ubiquinone oxidoreductase subunit NqrB